MKKLILILLLVMTGCSETNIIQPELQTDGTPTKPFVTLTIENGQFSGDSTYSFEVYAKGNIPNIYVGNTTIALYVENKFPFSALKNPELTFANPKYTLGAPGYYPMYVEEYSEKDKEFGVYLQIVYLQNQGAGNMLSTDKEKIAVIKCKVEFCVFNIVYDNEMTFFKNTANQIVLTGNYGILEGCH